MRFLFLNKGRVDLFLTSTVLTLRMTPWRKFPAGQQTAAISVDVSYYLTTGLSV